MKLELYNTLDKKISEFKPREAGKVGLYACGLTVYDYTHLGHLRKYTMDDVLVRALRYKNLELQQRLDELGSDSVDIGTGYAVTFVQNVTDVGHLASDGDTGEDKLEKGAKKYNKTVWDIAREFEEYFFMSMDKMGNLLPDTSCRATEHIQEQLDMVMELEKKGYTYVIEGDGVYFDTSKFPEYGKMAGLNLVEQEAGAGNSAEVAKGKRNPADFALWKFEREGENRAMSWPSPWSEKSFPGWHIECSAMAMKYLGDQFDIHTGGIDHIPVHHTNEIAQAEAVTGKEPFVKHWVHHNFLKVDGTKMSKSLGNFYTIDDVLEKGFDAFSLRSLFLRAHYRSELNFTWENLAGSQKAYLKLLERVRELETAEKITPKDIQNEALKIAHSFFSTLTDDLNTAQAMSYVDVLMKSDISDAEKKYLLSEFDTVLGLQLFKQAEKLAQKVIAESLPPEILTLQEKRDIAKIEKDYATADKIRKDLEEKGYRVLDTETGSILKKQ